MAMTESALYAQGISKTSQSIFKWGLCMITFESLNHYQYYDLIPVELIVLAEA